MRAFMESVEDRLRIPSSSFQIHRMIFSAKSYRLQVFGITDGRVSKVALSSALSYG
jgi:hypothetical protein